MKLKRTVFVVGLCILFLVCYTQMASKIDPFARYSYITEDNEEIIRKYITDPEDIDYIISLKIQPESFMEFIKLPDFKVKNILYYQACKINRPIDNNEIIKFVNEYRDGYSVASFELVIKNYTYETIKNYFDNGYPYFEDANLVEDPSKLSTILDDKDVVMNYVPANLVAVEPTLIQIAPTIEGNNSIQLRFNAYNALKGMMEAYAQDDYELYKTLSLTDGYVSYEDQIKVYDAASKKYDADFAVTNAANGQNNVEDDIQDNSKNTDNKEENEEKEIAKEEALNKITDLPGRSEHQLGFTITLKINDLSDIVAIEKSEQYEWLSENAHKYGYIFRYPKDKESVTGKTYQVLTLRYVGIDNATEVYDSKKAFDEIKAKDE